jgi:hypothetical protein
VLQNEVGDAGVRTCHSSASSSSAPERLLASVELEGDSGPLVMLGSVLLLVRSMSGEELSSKLMKVFLTRTGRRPPTWTRHASSS